jgi:hypothetical protein
MKASYHHIVYYSVVMARSQCLRVLHALLAAGIIMRVSLLHAATLNEQPLDHTTRIQV